LAKELFSKAKDPSNSGCSGDVPDGCVEIMLCLAKQQLISFLQVFFRGAYWIRYWSQLSKEKERMQMKEGCLLLEVMVLEVFGKFGWRHHNRIKLKFMLVVASVHS
jgi:hypothetical protein